MTTGYARVQRWAVCALMALAATTASAATGAPSTAESRKLHALFERHWQYTARTFPEGATYRGDHRHGSRLTDPSPAARTAQDAAVKRWLAEARRIHRARLAPTDRISLDLFISNQQRAIEFMPFAGYRSMSIGALGGAQTQFAELMQVTPMDTPGQARQLLQRFAAMPRQMQDEIMHLREGLRLGWVPPREVLTRALEQIDKQLASAMEDSPFY